jgi:hypothetical protein
MFKRPTGWLCLAFVALGIALTPGCGQSVLPPPVTISYRDSIVGVGRVIGITNTSAHHLYNVNVVCLAFDSASSASVQATGHLSPGESVEVGWMEFIPWVPEPGETVEVYCADYATPCISVVP